MDHLLTLMADPSQWLSFATLTVLEIVLGIDNVIFLAILSEKVSPEKRKQARYIGLIGALVLRIALLFSITWVIGLTKPIFTIGHLGISWRDLILIGGGLFLIYKATTEIHGDIEGEELEANKKPLSFGMAIIQIMVIDLIFSLDSVITAVGIATEVYVMIGAVAIAIAMMAVASGFIADFIKKHPSIKLLALAFLIMVGMVLIADGFHYHIERGFVYFAMAFSIAVETLNILVRRKKERQYQKHTTQQ